MKRFFYLIFLLIVTVSTINSSPISPEEAWKRVEESSNAFINTRAFSSKPILKKTFKTIDGKAAIYIFNQEKSSGYIVVSADNSTLPVLGYSDSGTFNIDDISPELNYWLNEYTRQIEYLRSEGAIPISTRAGITLPNWTEIQPLIKTKWDQETPYNLETPKNSKGDLTMTGCVATAMAQVMKFYNYPAKGNGKISYKWFNGKDSVVLTKDFSKINFDWNNMIDSYSGNYSSSQANAVATLMAAAGYSVQMDYGDIESGAPTQYIPNALINYFGYDKGVRFYRRRDFQYSEWAEMIYNNLVEYGPVLYDGSGEAGGHSFILDGYDGKGYFHFNWGWSGTSDGYYLLDLLNPPAIGIGGGSGGFILDQNAIFYLKPGNSSSSSTPQQTLQIYGSLTGKINRNTLNLYLTDNADHIVIYQGEDPVTLTLGVKFEDTASSDPKPIYVASSNFTGDFSTGAGYYLDESYPAIIDLTKANLTRGKEYKVTGVYLLPNGQWSDLVAENGFSNFFYLTRTGTDKTPIYTIKEEPVKTFSSKHLEITSPLYYGSTISFEATIENNNDIDLTQTVTLALFDKENNMVFTGENFLVTLAPGESITDKWATSLTKLRGNAVTSNTDYYLGLYDYESDLIYYISKDTVTMKPKAPTPVYTGSVNVTGSKLDNNVYMIDDASNFEIVTEISVSTGFFSYPVEWLIYKLEPGTINLYYAYSNYYDFQTISSGETKTFSAIVDFQDASVSDTYYINAGIKEETGISYLLKWNKPYKFKSASSGIESMGIAAGIDFLVDQYSRVVTVVSSERSVETVNVYNASGSRLPANIAYSHGGAQIDMSKCGSGIFIINVIDENGKQKSVKVAL